MKLQSIITLSALHKLRKSQLFVPVVMFVKTDIALSQVALQGYASSPKILETNIPNPTLLHQ